MKPSAGLERMRAGTASDVAGLRSARLEAQRRTRTGDPFLTMEVLYQLS
jgi:hypothetical protein